MRQRTRLSLGAAAAIVAIGAGSVVGIAASGGDDDQPLTGTALERASAAALAHTGGGTVTETEVGDDGAAYGVEVRLPDGSQVEVNVASDFSVSGSEADDDGAGDDGAGDD